MNDIIYLMMIFIKLNIHKHNLYANINLNNAIIIMFSYYDCIIEITFQIAFRIKFQITFEITFQITFLITFEIAIFIRKQYEECNIHNETL